MARKTYAEYRADNLRRTAANGGIAPTTVHNINTRYAWNCVCRVCMAAVANRQHTPARQSVARRQKLDRLARTEANGGVAPVKKHTYSTYGNWGCRCVPCKTDHAKKMRERTQ